ncbi:bifunctional protein RIB2 [Rhypophila sp. PSN 637]
MDKPQPNDHEGWMRYAMQLAQRSPPKPTNFRVGAVLVDASNNIMATGYTLEFQDNVHAEQVCFMKLAREVDTPEEKLQDKLPSGLSLYTTMEPCSKRLSGNLPCVKRVLRLKSCIKTVYVGVVEPETFVAKNTGKLELQDAGIEVVHVPGLEDEILKIATAGHIQG